MSISLSSEFHETSESVDAGKHGKDYELELSKFLFKRVLDNEFKNFKFTREKKGLGKFDDLVLVSEKAEVTSYTLIQFKHCQDVSKTITFESLAKNKNSYFYLPKYFDYYLESMKTISNDPDFSGANLGELIMCTNIELSKGLSVISKIKLQNEGLFKNSGSLYRLSLPNADKRKIFVNNYLSSQVRLAHELCFYAMFNKQIDVGSLVKDEHSSLIKDYNVWLALFVIDVPNKNFKIDFLENTFSENPSLYTFREAFLNSLNDFYDAYKDSETEELKHSLNISKKKAGDLKQRFKDYELKGAIQFLKDVNLTIKGKFGNETLYPNYCRTFPSREIDAEEIDRQLEIFLNSLTFATEQRNNENIIRKELSSDIMIALTDKMNQWYHSGSYEDLGSKTTRKREWITKAKLRSQALNTSVIFQGRRVGMRKLVNDEYVFDSDILMMVFCSQEIHIGSELCEDESLAQYYIPRVLTRQTQINKSVLMEGKIDVILLSSSDSGQNEILELLPEETTLYDLHTVKQQTHFIHVPQNFHDEDFFSFVNKYKDIFEWKNVHWLEVYEKQLVWRKTFGSLSTLHTYFRDFCPDADSVNESELLTKGRYIVIVGEPGMGKSTLLHNTALTLMKSTDMNTNPVWIMKILLKDCVQVIKTCSENFSNLNYVAEFLVEMGKIEGTFCQNILKHFLLKDQIIVILDGFDELSSANDRNKILKLLRCLRNNFLIKQILVSTRPHLRDDLENCLGVVSFSIKEISEQQQKEFLYKYWKNNSNTSDEHIHQHATRLVEHFNTQIKDHERTFLGIPLQTYMFAVAFLNEMIKDEPIIERKMPINVLFKHFLEAKYEIYLKKSGSVSLPEDIKQLFMQSLDEAHQNFALCHGECLTEDCAKMFMMEGKTITADTLLMIGIVYNRNNSFHFIHKTLYEYLLARRMTSVILNSERNSEDYETLFEQLILKPENDFLLYLFDTELTEFFPLHRVVLNGDVDKVRNFQVSDVNAKDCLGRGLAYYAVQYNHFDVIKMLLHMGAFSEKYDPFVMKSLIRYVRRSYSSSSDQVQKNAKLFALLFRFSSQYSLKLLETFDLQMEMKSKSWTLVRKILLIYRLSNMFSESFFILESALKFGAPLDVVVFIFETIQMSKTSFDPSLMSYSSFMNYIFMSEFQSINKLLSQYKSSFSTLYRNMPLFVAVYEYFDLKGISFGNSVSSLLASVKKRAEQYVQIVQLLLEHGAAYIILPNGVIEDVFSRKQYSNRFLKQPIHKFLEDKYSFIFLNSALKTLPNEADHQKIQEQSSYIAELSIEFWKSLEEYAPDFSVDMDQTVKESIMNIVEYVLKCSDAAKLLYLAFMFFEGIKANNYECVSNCLKTAEESGWTKALLGATDGDFKTGEELAKSNLDFRIYLLLRKHRRKPKRSTFLRKLKQLKS